MGQQKIANKEQGATPAKLAAKRKLMEHLSDPEKDFPRRIRFGEVCGWKNRNNIYRHFTPEELTEIETEALEERKKRCTRKRSNILDALYKRATGYSHEDVHISSYMGNAIVTPIVKHYPPDRQAAQEYLDRTEGKVMERHKHEFDLNSMSDEELENRIKALTSQIAEDEEKRGDG